MGDSKQYFSTWGKEFSAVASRVRLLIGKAHWLTDGKHKESLLKNYLRQKLPASVGVENGFIVSRIDEGNISGETDIIVYSKEEFLPFYENDVIVAYPKAILGWIHVKSKYGRNEIKDIADANAKLNELVANQREVKPFSGAFFFEDEDVRNTKKMKKWINEFGENFPTSLCVNNAMNLIKLPSNKTENDFKFIDSGQMALAIFLSDLIDTTTPVGAMPKFTQEISEIDFEVEVL